MTTTHEKVLVHGPVEFAHILGLSLHVQGNQHGCMTVQGYLNPASAQRESLRDLEGCLFCLQALRSMDSETPSPVFWGTADDFQVNQVGDVFIADIHIVTPTAMLDVVPRSRSFQDISMTYKQVVEDILSDTPNASAAIAEIANQPIKRPLIQYKETDWAFIKRLASMLGTQLIPDCTTPFPYFSFGQVPQMAEALSADEYVIISDSRFYEMGSSEIGLYKPDFLCYSVPSPQFYRAGDQTVFLGQPMSVCEQDAVLQDGELLYTYKIGRAGWFSQREIPNRKLIGLCLPGTVAWTDREVLHIDLDIDAGREPGYYPFSWIPESGNIIYCMPKLGTRAMLYLPSCDTGEAVTITSPRTNGDTCGAMTDPQLRCLTTEHGKRMCLFPQNMIFSGGNPGEVLHVEFNDLSCMLMESTRAIQIAAKLQIEIEAPRVTLSTPQEIQVCRAPARARAKVSLIVPKGTGGGNPPTGGKNTFMTMQYQFDLLGEKGILCGTDFKTYDPIPDKPDTKSFNLGSLLLGVVIGVAVAVVVVASVATFGVAATALGALAVASMLCLSGCSGQPETPTTSNEVTIDANDANDLPPAETIDPEDEEIFSDSQTFEEDTNPVTGVSEELIGLLTSYETGAEPGEGGKLLKQGEPALQPYHGSSDRAQVRTIGWGHAMWESELYTLRDGRTVDLYEWDTVITKEDAYDILRADIEPREQQFNNFLEENNVSLTQQQYDGFIMLGYQFGMRCITDPDEYTLARMIKYGKLDEESITEAFLDYNNHKQIGTMLRCLDELDVIFRGEYERDEDRSRLDLYDWTTPYDWYPEDEGEN